MAQSLGDRLKHAWNAFFNKDPTMRNQDLGMSYGYRPDRVRFSRGNERTIVTSIYNRIALDVAAIQIQHVKIDENERFSEKVKSALNDCFNLSKSIFSTFHFLTFYHIP